MVDNSDRTKKQNRNGHLVARAFPALDRMSVGVFAREQASGQVIVDYNSTVPLPPASNTKLITTALALDRLGPDHRFEIRARGNRKGISDSETERLDSVVLWSDRSPVIERGDLVRLAETMRDAGISSVGDIALDVSDHDTQEYGPGWMWNDEQHYYGAKITPIAVDGNTVEVTVLEDKSGSVSDVSVVLEPDSSVVELSCALELADETDKNHTTDEMNAADDTSDTNETSEIEAFRRRGSNQIRVTGCVAPNETHRVTLPVGDPLQHAGDIFRQALSRSGINVDGEVRVVTEAPTLSESENASEYDEWTVESPPVSEIIRAMNHPSDNFIAEQLARSIAREGHESKTGSDSWEEWKTVVETFIESRGVTGYRLRDGSGLSRYNRISAYGLATVVDWAVDRSWGDVFLDSLPVAGRDGTLSDRLGDLRKTEDLACQPEREGSGDIEATIRAKTGSLTGTRTLTGVIEQKGEDTTADITFSAMVTNLTGEHESQGKEYLDTFVRELIADARQ